MHLNKRQIATDDVIWIITGSITLTLILLILTILIRNRYIQRSRATTVIRSRSGRRQTTRMTPVNDHFIKSLPEYEFQNDNIPLSDRSTPQELQEHGCCTICLEEFQHRDNVKSLPCLHQFHSTCINQWLSRDSKPSCPICKSEVIVEVVGPVSLTQKMWNFMAFRQ